MPPSAARRRRAALDFGAAQTGDVSAGDVAGGDITYGVPAQQILDFIGNESEFKRRMLDELRIRLERIERDSALYRDIDSSARHERQGALDHTLWRLMLAVAGLAIVVALLAAGVLFLLIRELVP